MTVLLDTNVVSELIRKSPDPAVEAWATGHPLEDLFFSAVGEAELRYGAAILPTGRRQETLVSDIERMPRDALVLGHVRAAPGTKWRGANAERRLLNGPVFSGRPCR